MASLKFMHLSDLHIGKADNEEYMDTIVKGIISSKDTHRCGTILITGDITDDGHRWQYKIARKYIGKLEKEFKVISLPGNHDYGWNGILESECSRKSFHKYLDRDDDYPVVDIHDGIAYVSIDSMEKEMQDTEFPGAQGEIGKNQLLELDAEIDDLKSNKKVQKIVVALHHHPFFLKRVLKLRDASQFLSVVKGRTPKKPRVDALVFGHKHVEHEFKDKEVKYDIPFIFAGSQSTAMKKGNKGKAVFKTVIIDLKNNSFRHFEIPA